LVVEGVDDLTEELVEKRLLGIVLLLNVAPELHGMGQDCILVEQAPNG
jgi:hypothetical protein